MTILYFIQCCQWSFRLSCSGCTKWHCYPWASLWAVQQFSHMTVHSCHPWRKITHLDNICHVQKDHSRYDCTTFLRCSLTFTSAATEGKPKGRSVIGMPLLPHHPSPSGERCHLIALLSLSSASSSFHLTLAHVQTLMRTDSCHFSADVAFLFLHQS